MRPWRRFRLALTGCAATACLAGCGGEPPTGTFSANLQTLNARLPERASPQAFHVIYRFSGGRDGAGPAGGLIDVSGTLYGVTSAGGGHPQCLYGTGCGTIFSISTTGAEKVLHRFAGGTDGADPFAALIDANGTLYGTTRYGGGDGCVQGFGCGTVYTVTTSGKERVTYAFGTYANGTQPIAPLIDVDGSLYGTTYQGGTSNLGTVFSLDTRGVETVLHSFNGQPDGALPYGGLVEIKGTLYGTTWAGGSGCGSTGCGTVFRITKGGDEKVIYRFAGGSDGSFPNAGLIAINGVMYGTTTPFLCCNRSTGWGTAYSVTTSGKEHILHHFGHGSDGAQPTAELVSVNGILYGTTRRGGSATSCGTGSSGYPGGCGTIFSLTTTGKEKVLHSFDGGSGGELAGSPLTYVNGTFFGTTAAGGRRGCGTYGNGCGTVFSFSL